MKDVITKGLAIMFLAAMVSFGSFAIATKAADVPKDSTTAPKTPTTVIVPTTVPQQTLGDLIVLNSLFNPSTSVAQRNADLAGLIAVDRAVGGGYGYGGYYAGAGGSSLGDLIVLNGLFNGNGAVGISSANNLNGLAGLIAVDRVVGGSTAAVPVYGGYYPAAGGSSLGDLIVLNSLFNGGTANSNLNGLAGLIAVDRSVH